MKQTTKRLVGILLTLLMLFSVGTLYIFAADATTTQVEVKIDSVCSEGGSHQKDSKSLVVLRDFSCVEDMKTTYGVDKNYKLYYCKDCGKLVREVFEQPTGHTEKVVEGTPATCYAEGKSDGVECAVCGKVLKEQEVLKKIGHTDANNDGWCDVEECKAEITAHCGFCGEIHPDTFIGKITAFFHGILANFGLKK